MNDLNEKEIQNGLGTIAFLLIKICLGDSVASMEKEAFQGNPKWAEENQSLIKVHGPLQLS